MASTRNRLRSLPTLVGTPPRFDPERAPEDPVKLFIEWLDLAIASGTPEPHAMTVSTIGLDGIPDARILILKDVTESGQWCFASEADSAKGFQLAENPVAALTFYWPVLARSVRLRGRIEVAPPDVSEQDLVERGAAAREALESRSGGEPHVWSVWMLRPIAIEFWQASEARQHLRVHYRLVDDRWTVSVSQ